MLSPLLFRKSSNSIASNYLRAAIIKNWREILLNLISKAKIKIFRSFHNWIVWILLKNVNWWRHWHTFDDWIESSSGKKRLKCIRQCRAQKFDLWCLHKIKFDLSLISSSFHICAMRKKNQSHLFHFFCCGCVRGLNVILINDFNIKVKLFPNSSKNFF